MQDARLAADQLHADVLATATEKFRASRKFQIDLEQHTRAGAVADEGRAAGYAFADRDHKDRLAALQRHFGQAITSREDPDATHAQAFLASVDPDGQFAPAPTPVAAGTPRVIEHHIGVRHTRLVDANGRVVPEQSTQVDPPRGTFTGSPAAYAMAKTRGAVTPREIAEAEAFLALQASEEPAMPTTPPEPAPPPGLLRDIAATLARAAR